MNKDIKKYLWLLYFLGGILLIISAVTPSASVTFFGTIYVWLWGSMSSGYATQMIPDMLIVTIGIITLIMLLLSGILAVAAVYGYKTKKIKKEYKELEKIWLLLATISIVITIIYIVIFGTSSYMMGWQVFNPGFGVIGPFIGAGLIIAGYLISNKM